MSSWISFIPAVEHTRNLARSALPDAPVVPDSRPPQPRIRTMLSATLRASALRSLQLAEWIDPPRRYNAQPS
jgi:hypothetical protein